MNKDETELMLRKDRAEKAKRTGTKTTISLLDDRVFVLESSVEGMREMIRDLQFKNAQLVAKLDALT